MNSRTESVEGVSPGMKPGDLLYEDSVTYECKACGQSFETWLGGADHQRANCEDVGLDINPPPEEDRARWIDEDAEFDWWVSDGEGGYPERRTLPLWRASELSGEGKRITVAEPPRGGPA
jgi:hypothetical protein